MDRENSFKVPEDVHTWVEAQLSGLPFWMGFAILLGYFFVLYGLPIALVARRMGFGRIWWGIAMIPGIGAIALWVFALRRWPIEDRVGGLFSAAKHAGLLPGGRES